MELAAAYAALGVPPEAASPEIRAAYLRLVREHHPDGAADAADAGLRTVVTARVTEAYAVVAADRADADAGRPRPDRSTARVAPTRLADAVDETRRVWLGADIPDAFVALLEVFHLLGVVSYVDRHSAVLEAIVTPRPGEATSLLAFLEPGPEPDITEAVLGVEPLGRHAPAPLDPLVDEVARLLATERPPAPTSWHA
jgi:hypothetical protein